MNCSPITFDVLALIILSSIGVAILILMYLDGYWTTERVKARRDEKWKRDHPFSALDREHFGRGRNK